jgi:hypothetical protein
LCQDIGDFLHPIAKIGTSVKIKHGVNIGMKKENK